MGGNIIQCAERCSAIPSMTTKWHRDAVHASCPETRRQKFDSVAQFFRADAHGVARHRIEILEIGGRPGQFPVPAAEFSRRISHDRLLALRDREGAALSLPRARIPPRRVYRDIRVRNRAELSASPTRYRPAPLRPKLPHHLRSIPPSRFRPAVVQSFVQQNIEIACFSKNARNPSEFRFQMLQVLVADHFRKYRHRGPKAPNCHAHLM